MFVTLQRNFLCAAIKVLLHFLNIFFFFIINFLMFRVFSFSRLCTGLSPLKFSCAVWAFPDAHLVHVGHPCLGRGWQSLSSWAALWPGSDLSSPWLLSNHGGIWLHCWGSTPTCINGHVTRDEDTPLSPGWGRTDLWAKHLELSKCSYTDLIFYKHCKKKSRYTTGQAF